MLLHKLGFQLPADVGKVFPRFGLLRFLSPPSPVVAQDPPLLVRGPHLLGGGEAGPGGHEEVEVLFGGDDDDDYDDGDGDGDGDDGHDGHWTRRR